MVFKTNTNVTYVQKDMTARAVYLSTKMFMVKNNSNVNCVKKHLRMVSQEIYIEGLILNNLNVMNVIKYIMVDKH